jgi:uncharacterized membrane protein YfcA
MLFGTVAISIVILLSSTISSTIGFAFAPIAGVLLLSLPIEKTKIIEIILVASISVQSYSIFYLSAHIPYRRLAYFLAGGMVTLPIGVTLLLTLDASKYKIIIGIWLVLYSLYALFAPQIKIGRTNRIADAVVGTFGGITGPLAGFPGAFIVIWCNLQHLDPSEQRAIYQPYILAMQLMTLAALFVLGEPALIQLGDGIFAIQGLAGAMIGLRIFSRMKTRTFRTAVNAFLLLSGLSMAVTTLC